MTGNGWTLAAMVRIIRLFPAEYEEKAAQEAARKQLLQELKGKETVTLGGRPIRLYANIGGISDLQSVMQNDAAGIGLFRSEFLYLEKDHYPTEEEQFQVYRSVAETMAGKKVIIRTLDIGADKQIDYFNLDKEENPAVGYLHRVIVHGVGIFFAYLLNCYIKKCRCTKNSNGY